MSPEKILIVDDNAATRYAVRRVLERQGYGVVEAATGTDGLAMLAEQPILALVLDVNLPDMSGFDVVRRLRADDATRLLPVLHVSAASIQNRDLVTGLEAGADAYLVHPVDHDLLLATLRSLLRVRDAEQAMAASEARMRDIFANTAAPIAVLGTSLDVHESNAAFGRLFPAEGAARGSFDSQAASGQDAVLEQMRAAIGRDGHWTGILQTVGGRELDIRITPYREPNLGLMFIEDITEQRTREREQQARLDSEIAQREHADSQLLQLQKMDALGKLTGGIAHDFNNMLTGIMAGVDLITVSLEQGRPERVPRFAELITSSAQRAAGLTQRMLAFARQQPLDPRACDVNERVRSLEDLLVRTIGEHIGLELHLAPAPMVATVDVNQLENVIINLVINSRDALPEEGGRIRLLTRGFQAAGQSDLVDGDYVAVAVEDNGTGIPPELLEKVFDPFFTTKPIGKGTGLGLSMTYGFAKQSGGSVRISSRLGEGTRIELLFPAGGQAEAARVEPASLQHAATRQARVLLVDDNDAIRQTLTDILADAGYLVVEAAESQAALAALAGPASFDLLLTDVGLPGMSGRRLADLARQSHPAMPIVFMTGYTSEVVTEGGLLGEGMSLLAKPFSMRDLLEKVRATVR